MKLFELRPEEDRILSQVDMTDPAIRAEVDLYWRLHFFPGPPVDVAEWIRDTFTELRAYAPDRAAEWAALLEKRQPGCTAPLFATPAEDVESGSEHTVEFTPGSRRETEVAARIGAEYLRGEFLAVGRNLWYRWDGRRFERLESDAPVYGAVRRAVNDIAAKAVDEANDRLRDEMRRAEALEDESEQKEVRRAATAAHNATMKWVNSLFNIGRLRSFMVAAREVVAVRADELDTRHDLFNAANGVVNLRTGELLPHDPKYLFTRVSTTEYRPGAEHPDWMRVLEVIPADSREALQERFGWALTGFPPPDDVAPFLYGGGANGKSTVIDGVVAAAGEFAALIPPKVLLGNANDHPTEFMTLKGARLAYLEELPEGDYLNAQALKRIMGTGQITARFIGENSVTWTPTHSLFITTNHEVKVDAVDHGLRRRLAKFDFPVTFVAHPRAEHERQGDPTLRERVRRDKTVHAAALAWMVRGAMRALARGKFEELPARVRAATDEWWNSANQAIRFMDETFEPDPNSCVLVKDVFEAFRTWAEDHGRRSWNDQTFWARALQHPWFLDGTAAKTQCRLGSWELSSRGGYGKKPQKARVVTGIRFAEDAG